MSSIVPARPQPPSGWRGGSATPSPGSAGGRLAGWHGGTESGTGTASQRPLHPAGCHCHRQTRQRATTTAVSGALSRQSSSSSSSVKLRNGSPTSPGAAAALPRCLCSGEIGCGQPACFHWSALALLLSCHLDICPPASPPSAPAHPALHTRPPTSPLSTHLSFHPQHCQAVQAFKANTTARKSKEALFPAFCSVEIFRCASFELQYLPGLRAFLFFFDLSGSYESLHVEYKYFNFINQ